MRNDFDIGTGSLPDSPRHAQVERRRSFLPLRFHVPGPRLSLLLILVLLVCFVDTREEEPDVPTEGTLGIHPARILSLAYSPNGRWLASGGYECPVVLWNMEKERMEGGLEGSPADTFSLSFSPDGRLLVAAGENGDVHIWRTESWKVDRVVHMHDGIVRGLAFSPDGKLLATAGGDAMVTLWDTTSWNRRRTAKTPDGPLRLIAFSADGEKLATLSAGWDARLWDLDLHEQTLSVLRGAHGEKIPCSSLAFSPAETVISMPSLADQVMLYEPGSGRPQSVLKSSGGLILSMAFSPDGRSLAAGTRTGWVEIWNLATGERRSLDNRHTGAIWGLVFSPDGRTLATAGDRTVKVNEADAGPHPLSSASHD